MKNYYDTVEEIDEKLKTLPDITCPHCGRKRTLVRHDYIWRSGGKQNGMRGKRVYGVRWPWQMKQKQPRRIQQTYYARFMMQVN